MRMHRRFSHTPLRASEYCMWKEQLDHILHEWFGIGIIDCLEEQHLIRAFMCGESPTEVAGELENRRGLYRFTKW